MSEAQTAPTAARDARAQAWNATQWLARLAHSYVQPSVRDIALRWDGAASRVVTPELVPGISVGLSLATLILQFDEDGHPVPHPLELDDKSSSEVEAWILVELLHRDIDRERFSKSLPYETTLLLMSGEEPKYEAHGLVEELSELGAAFMKASEILARTAALSGGDGTDLVVWPERMEIGFVVPPRDGDPSGPFKVTWQSVSVPPCFQVGHGRDAIFLPDDEVSAPADLAARLAKRVAEVRTSTPSRR